MVCDVAPMSKTLSWLWLGIVFGALFIVAIQGPIGAVIGLLAALVFCAVVVATIAAVVHISE